MTRSHSLNYMCQTTANNFQHLDDETAIFPPFPLTFMSFLSFAFPPQHGGFSPVVREAGRAVILAHQQYIEITAAAKLAK